MTTCGGILGWVACALVFTTFLAREMRVLRTLAIFSNIAFIAYGGLYHLWPIVVLHGAMLPVNIVRLRQILVIGEETHSSPRFSAEPSPLPRLYLVPGSAPPVRNP